MKEFNKLFFSKFKKEREYEYIWAQPNKECDFIVLTKDNEVIIMSRNPFKVGVRDDFGFYGNRQPKVEMIFRRNINKLLRDSSYTIEEVKNTSDLEVWI